MEYEYKSILVTGNTELSPRNISGINDYFENGWEYVDSIVQTVAISASYSRNAFGSIVVILKKKKEGITL
jgi:hypothetical protein